MCFKVNYAPYESKFTQLLQILTSTPINPRASNPPYFKVKITLAAPGVISVAIDVFDYSSHNVLNLHSSI